LPALVTVPQAVFSLPPVDDVTSFFTAEVFVNAILVTCGILSQEAELSAAVVSKYTQASDGQHSSPAENGISNLHQTDSDADTESEDSDCLYVPRKTRL
jgi:hypothetical protein